MDFLGDRIERRPAQSRRVRLVGGGAAFLFAAASGAGWLACQPGALDCAEEPGDCSEYRPAGVTAGGGGASGSGGTGRGGSSGSGGAMGGSSGSGGAAGSAGPTVTPMATTMVKACPKFATLKAADDFFKMRCGINAGCHATGAPWSDFSMPDVWMRMADAKPKFACTMGKMIDKANPANSLMLIKAKNMMPKCPAGTGSNEGTVMPPPGNVEKQPALTVEEVTCIENFVMAASGRP
jgi:hypothetical protein